MITIKTDAEIELLRQCNLLVSATHAAIVPFMKPGMKTEQIDHFAEEFIRDNGAIPGFKGYQGYPSSLCISVNDQVVHGIPAKTELKEGDIVSVDCGVYMNGFHGDSAFTYEVGEVSVEAKKLMKVTRESLFFGIENAVVGKHIGDIGHAVQSHAERHGFSVVREMVGHGVGRNLHEAPEVPNYGRKGSGSKLKNGMVIAIEPMINMGQRFIFQEKDGWTICTSDGSMSAHFEHSVVIRQGKADILSDFSIIDEAIKKIG
ncbi:MAG: type I methionyl aminopeptidase [Bacteroidetes bacterium]|jgi:methionyl aminopeptidase|nr:type I methionyl aminopeptidase [Bacteroidota bacterium]MBT3749750.1 type I methionyl aminopeptidase [Bacteroidota bacterium]MBT4410046.1 type I methionyl aminopeptidase [Bacteroidota bacterium]MBT5428041.1 type I methionyl aminopeptidase [Bacteroidota bacterium]MBT7093799.1 type I methionyl aminopeptidase [Bacteroidota bacterium]